ncbi:MAG: hypothetical protein ABIZ91_01880 [Gemmatimonadaceae bacterium]
MSRELRLSEDGEPYHVVGVADDYKVDTPGEVPKAYLHLPLSREETYVNYVVCTFVAALGLVPALQREILVLDPELVLLDKGTVRDLADIRLCPVRAEAWLIGAFGVLALLVAGVGLAAVGGVIGAGLAAAARVMSSVLFVGAFDLVSFAVAFGVLALVAKLVPARRAGGGGCDGGVPGELRVVATDASRHEGEVWFHLAEWDHEHRRIGWLRKPASRYLRN